MQNKSTEIKLTSINVGLPREVKWKGKTVSTGIFKSPVTGPRSLRKHQLEGDRQADLKHHGGQTKAVYAYPSEHYTFWQTEYPDIDLSWGMFGENFTTEGLLESDVQIGDTFRIGSAAVVATEPRTPCVKLAIRFGRSDIVRRFHKQPRTGYYFGVVEEGTVQAGDSLTRIDRSTHGVTVAEITRLYAFDTDDWEAMRKVVDLNDLPDSWRAYFRDQLERNTA